MNRRCTSGDGRVVCLTLLLWICCGRCPRALGAERTLRAFPEAEGAGAFTIGGRAGKVYAVTTLEDYEPRRAKPIPGSLRAAVEASGPRTIVFRVGGIIALKAPLVVKNPRLTIAGQTAPADGICLRNYETMVNADEVIVRYLRCRIGDEAGKEEDALSVHQCKNVILDHCSASWSIDESVSVTGEGCGNVTVQWCLMAEGLDQSVHKKGTHGYGSLIRTDGPVTYHHNLYAHYRTRCPRPGTYGKPPGILFDFRNNVIYDWISPAGYSAEDAATLNYVGNYLKPGPSTKDRRFAFKVGGPQTHMYVEGNVLMGRDVKDQWNLVDRVQPGNKSDKPFPTPAIQTDTAEAAYQKVLATAGATLPRRDAVDARVIESVQAGTGKVINSQREVGGWPQYASGKPYVDTDGDGMPDDWETQHGLNPRDPSEGAKDSGDGYTNLEKFLNGLGTQKP